VKEKARLVATVSRPARLCSVSLGACAAALLLLPASGAMANGTLEVDVAGTGAGTVTSSAQVLVGPNPVAPAGAAPGQIDCDESDGPICQATFSGLGGSFTDVRVTLSAAPEPGSYLKGWQQSGASSVSSGCLTPPGEPSGCVLNLNGNPGPTAEATAVFDLLPDPPPTVTGATADGAGFALATLEGTVDPEGAEVAECYFEYGTTTDYGVRVPCEQSTAEIGEESDPVPVSASTEPLEPNAAYHYRLVAGNAGGTSHGEDRAFVTGPVPSGGCPNEPRRQEQGIAAILLPDCMALEMVSPPAKGNQRTSEPSVSADAGRVAFRSPAALSGSAGVVNLTGDIYVAGRGAAGWSTAPTIYAGIDKLWNGTTTATSFTPDFSRWLALGASERQDQTGTAQAYEGSLGGSRKPLSPLLVPLAGGEGLLEATQLRGASADHTHAYFKLGDSAYFPDDPIPSGAGADELLYVVGVEGAGQTGVELLARDKHDIAWGGSCGARLHPQGSISPDGARVYLSARPAQPASGACDTKNPLRILRRVGGVGGATIQQLFASECYRPDCSAVDGDDLYQGASRDGTEVYFTTNRQLVDTDLDAGAANCSASLATATSCDLYLYNSKAPAGERLTQVSAGDGSDATPGEGANVLNGATAVSADGSRIYFVAKDVLTTEPNPAGDVAQAGQPNLYLWEAEGGATGFVGTLSSGDVFSGAFSFNAYPVPLGGVDAAQHRLGGRVLLFQSKASLTADDGDGAARDLFRYDSAAQTLVRVSKAAPGGSDDGAFDTLISNNSNRAGTDFAQIGRWTSEDGLTVAFSTEEGLVPGDRNGAYDFYLWRGGQLFRLPGRIYRAGTVPFRESPALSADGSTVAFQTRSQLLPQDGDSAPDVYVARTGGGFPVALPAQPCEPQGSCQGPTPAPPAAVGAPSAAFAGAGNLAPRRSSFCRARPAARPPRPRPAPHRQAPCRQAQAGQAGPPPRQAARPARPRRQPQRAQV
jgi:hypothetical protein